MLKYFYVGDIGEGLFWFLVVIITIVVQIIKASKKASQSGQSIQKETKGYISPEEELQNFLESLTGGPRSGPEPTVERPQVPTLRQAAVSPAPPPIPVRHAQPPRIREPVRPAPQGEKAHPKKPVRKDETQQAVSSTVSIKKPQFPVQTLRNALGADLISRNMLRKAIILHETLGPPLALRKPSTAATQSTQY